MNKTFLSRGFSVVLVAAAFVCAQARNPEVEALLAKMRGAYGAVKSAKFTSLVYATAPLHPLGCTSYFLAPGFYRVDVKDIYGETPPRDATFITDGKTTYVTPKGSGQTQSEPFSVQEFYNVAPGNVESFSFFAGKEFLSDAHGTNFDGCRLRILKDQKWDGKSWNVLEATLPDQTLYKFYFDPKTYFIWRTTAVRASGELRVDTQVKSLELGVEVPGSVFKVGSVGGRVG